MNPASDTGGMLSFEITVAVTVPAARTLAAGPACLLDRGCSAESDGCGSHACIAGAASRGLRVPSAGSWIEPNSRSGARNLIEYRYRALPGKETSMYIGIGTIVLIVIIVLVILMLRRR